MIDHGLIAIGPEPADAAAVAIFVHGRHRSPDEMRELALQLALPLMRFIMPAAPGGTWYPESFMAPIERNEPSLSASLAGYAQIVDELLELGVPEAQIVLAGFSQGACLTAEMLVRHPRRYGAALILTGGLIGPPGTRWPAQPDLAGVPIYLTGSRVDEWVPVTRVEETERVLRESGAIVKLRVFEDRSHHVCEEEIAAMRDMLSCLAARNAIGKAAASAAVRHRH